MIFKVNNIKKDYGSWGLPAMNFGQFRRGVGQEPLPYQMEFEKDAFLEKIADQFYIFRQGEMADNEPEGFEELEAFKRLGWPMLTELANQHSELLSKLVLFNDYDFLDQLWNLKDEVQFSYSVNSLDHVRLHDDLVVLEGRCIEIFRN